MGYGETESAKTRTFLLQAEVDENGAESRI
jgi:hypothetical protein